MSPHLGAVNGLSARLAVEAKDEVLEARCQLFETLLDADETVVHTRHRLGEAVKTVLELFEAVVVTAELGCDGIRRLAAGGRVGIEHARRRYRVPRRRKPISARGSDAADDHAVDPMSARHCRLISRQQTLAQPWLGRALHLDSPHRLALTFAPTVRRVRR